MNKLVSFFALIGAVASQAPIWYPGGLCGQSKYPDAGQNCTTGSAPCAASGPSTNVVGGIEASQGEFPFMVQLRDKNNNNEIVCGGTIINEEWVMTSAYCTSVEFLDDPARILVVVGAHSRVLGSAPNEASYDVDYVIPFETYTFIAGTPNENDISILQLSTPIVMNEDVTPVCAPDPNVDYTTGETVIMMGWGDESRNDLTPPDTLRYVGLTTFSNSYCSTQYAVFGDVITDRMVCASDTANHENRDFCEGDKGGPLVYNDNGVFRQVGIASYEQRCANGYPGVYTDVADPNINVWVSSKLVNRTTSAIDEVF